MKAGKSLSTKIILIVVTILLLSTAAFCVVSVSRTRIGIRQAIQQRMVDIANCAAGSVNGDVLKTLRPGDEDTPGYKAVYDSMAVFRDNAELEYVYAIRDEGSGKFTFIVDTDPDEPGAFGDEVKYTEALNKASKGTTAVDEVPYSDQWGSFYSAYSPVWDSGGRVVGIVAADFAKEWFDAQLHEQTLSTIRDYLIVLALMLLGAVALCLVIVRPYVRLQEQLLGEKVVAESANEAKSEFLANMSHEIRTPINAVLGMNEMILRESIKARRLTAEQPEEALESFEQIGTYAAEVDSAGRSLLTIINDILDFSKIEAGRMELVKGRYRLSKLLNDVSNMIAYKAREQGLEFTLETDENLPENLFGDAGRVREVITNILNNAVKYTEKGYVRMKVHARDLIGSTIRLVITVEDSGIGIRQEDMDRLFTKFERLDMHRNSTVEGSGLGLVITRRLLDMMAGTISVESEYGKGSVFTVTIPQRVALGEPAAEVQMIPAEERAEYREAFRAPDATVLIVDDTKMNLTVTASLLKDTEVRINTALSGAEAVALAEKNTYDVILMDQRMPGMDGTEALRRIRDLKDNPNSKTPVICLTADAIDGARERYIAEGFTDYLTKPVEGRKLEETLMKYLPAEKVMRIEVPAEKLPVSFGDGGDSEPLREAGIDPETGLFYCQGDQKLYHTLLREYERDYQERAEALHRNFEDENWKDYGIYVHSLKSTSRMLGAQELSEMAAALEAAAKAEDGDTIRRGHASVLARYETTVNAIREYIGAPETGDDPDVIEFEPEA